MSEKEFMEMESRIDEGLALANRRMLEEKALRGETIVVYDREAGATVRIKAKDVIETERKGLLRAE